MWVSGTHDVLRAAQHAEALPSPEELPAYDRGVFPRERVRWLPCQAGMSDSAPRHSGAGTANPHWPLSATAVGSTWGQPPPPPSVGLLSTLTGTPLPSKCLERCSKGLIRAQIRVRSTRSITGQLFCDFSLTFLSRMLETICLISGQRPGWTQLSLVG